GAGGAWAGTPPAKSSGTRGGGAAGGYFVWATAAGAVGEAATRLPAALVTSPNWSRSPPFGRAAPVAAAGGAAADTRERGPGAGHVALPVGLRQPRLVVAAGGQGGEQAGGVGAQPSGHVQGVERGPLRAGRRRGAVEAELEAGQRQGEQG